MEGRYQHFHFTVKESEGGFREVKKFARDHGKILTQESYLNLESLTLPSVENAFGCH